MSAVAGYGTSYICYVANFFVVCSGGGIFLLFSTDTHCAYRYAEYNEDGGCGERGIGAGGRWGVCMLYLPCALPVH